MNTQSSSKRLQGLRLVISGFELEQREHRGIAAYTKNLIHLLKNEGAEIWILTEFSPSIQDLKSRTKLTDFVLSTILATRTLEALNQGSLPDEIPSPLRFRLDKTPLIKNLLYICDRIKLAQKKFVARRYFSARSLTILPKLLFQDGPYKRYERLSFLSDVDGLICAKHIFSASMLLAKKRFAPPLKVDLRDFDGFISTSPLNILPLHTRLSLQTIHDLIPLEFKQTGDHLACFAVRLKSANRAHQLFVSEDANYKYNLAFKSSHKDISEKQAIVVQPPSLNYSHCPDWATSVHSLKRCSRMSESNSEQLKPFNYFLFNSSVVPHKNLLFALEAFLDSGLMEQGIKFCITGQPHHSDPYSDSVIKIASEKEDIIFTGYVDESTKQHLYLNAIALISPSLIEGFGIPVLDGACLGLPVIASPINSHREIYKLFDFRKHIRLCSLLSSESWTQVMRVIGLRSMQHAKQIGRAQRQLELSRVRQERVRRQIEFKKLIASKFQDDVSNHILRALAVGD